MQVILLSEEVVVRNIGGGSVQHMHVHWLRSPTVSSSGKASTDTLVRKLHLSCILSSPRVSNSWQAADALKLKPNVLVLLTLFHQVCDDWLQIAVST